MTRLNAILDTLPRTRFGRATRDVPAFRTCGVVGFYLAVATAMGGALLAGVSLLVMSVVAVICGASFFVYVYARRWLTGKETLELIDQVWFAELCTAGALLALGVPLLPYLDVLAVALCPFLSAGRVGCTLVGCCHGRPSSLGITYGEEHARDGFPAHLVGIRLFPVPALEALGLSAIGLTGLVALPFAPAGYVFAWFLVAYAILRFGLEWLRGDLRPQWLGLSKPQWMSILEFGVGLWIVEGVRGATGLRDLLLAGLLVLVLAATLSIRRRLDPRGALLGRPHLAELAGAVATALGNADLEGPPPTAIRTSQGVSIAISRTPVESGEHRHVSYSVVGGSPDCALLCELAAATLPTGAIGEVWWSDSGVLHVVCRIDAGAPAGEMRTRCDARTLYGLAVAGVQAAYAHVDERNGHAPRVGHRRGGAPGRADYFGRSPGVRAGGATLVRGIR
jgi:hypothetical protein